MATPPSSPAPDSGGIRIGDVGGSVNFSALGDIVGGDKITTITTTIQISVEAVTQRPLITASPYRGLDRFEDRDKDLFFGRDQLIKSLLAQLSASNVLLVLGASGSGKSSVVRAGLLPQLSQLIGARFRYFTLVPDVNPFESLRSALQGGGFSQTQTRELAEARPETPAKLIHALQREGDQWLVFVDQFEEIFTVGDEKLRASFIAALVAIAQDPQSSTKLVLAMRADFLDRFSPFPQFAKIVEKNIDFVADMHADELRQAIEQPAARHGVVFEAGLVEEIIKDVQGQAGSLPLLQYTLDLLWQGEVRANGLTDRHLNAKAYRELGGVRGALQKRADEIYASFGDGSDGKAATAKQEIVRQIFLRLVDLAGEGSNDAAWRPVRRRASMTMFTAAQEQEILQALINQKLLVSNREGDDATVEVAHEALFTSWERLKNWIGAGQQVIFARNRLADDARRWQRRKDEHDAGADEELLSGSRLSQAIDMRARGDFATVVGGLGETETQFLEASAALRDRRRQEEQERQQRELAQAQALAAEQKQRADEQARAAVRQRRLTRVMIALAVVGFGAATIALIAKWQATKATRAAQDALTRSFARTIGVSREKMLTADERTALWELAELDSANAPVREKVIEHWYRDSDSIPRALRREAQGLHSAVGLNPSLRKQVVPRARSLAKHLIEEMENTPETDDDRWQLLGSALPALTVAVEPREDASVAERAVQALENPKVTSPDIKWHLAGALATLIAHLEPKAAASLAGRGAQVLTKTLEGPEKMDDYRRALLENARAALVKKMEPKQAALIAATGAQNWEQLLKDPKLDPDFFSSVTTLLARMEPKEVTDTCERLVRTLENPTERNADRMAGIGSVVAAATGRLDPKDAASFAARAAEVLAKALENPQETAHYRLENLGTALAGLGNRLDARANLSLAERLLKALENPETTDKTRLCGLGNALARLANRLEPTEATRLTARGAKVVAQAMETPDDSPFPLSSELHSALAALTAWTDPKETASLSARGADVLTKALENQHEFSFDRISSLASALASMASRLEHAEAANLARRLTVALEEYQKDILLYRLSSLASAVAALARRMEAKESASLAARGVQAMIRALENRELTDPDRPSNLGRGIAILAERMPPTEIAEVAYRLARALRNPRESDAFRLSNFGWALGGVSRLIPEARQTRLVAFSNMLFFPLSAPPELEDTDDPEGRKQLADLCAVMSPQDLSEVLKWPFCVGEAQKIALAELEKKTGRKFGGDVWKFVEQAPSLGIKDLDAPAKRPRIEDALKELEALRASAKHN